MSERIAVAVFQMRQNASSAAVAEAVRMLYEWRTDRERESKSKSHESLGDSEAGEE